MIAHTLAPNAGWRWLLAGFAIFRRNPVGLTLLIVCYWFTILLIDLLPLLGPLLASIAVPGLSVGLMQAARHAERDEPFGLATLFSGWRRAPRPLALLGAIYLFCTLSALGLSALADGGEFVSIMFGGQAGQPPSGDDILLPALIVMLCMVPVLMAYWFAPVLLVWHDLPVGKALFFSFHACRLNWRPFLHYGLTLMALSIVLPSVLTLLVLAVAPGAAAAVPMFVMLPLMLVLLPSVFASFYASYREVFGVSEIA